MLTNGFRLHADRHEAAGDKVRIYDAGGVRQLPASSVAAFEVEDAVREQTSHPAETASILPPEIATVSKARQTPVELAGSVATRFALPPGLVIGVMRTESGFNPAAVSARGAIGLMQLMPATALELGVDPHDPQQNTEGGVKYLRNLLARYEDRPDQVLLALAAYNAGAGAVEKFKGVPPYRETREYILKVLKNWDLSTAK